MDSLTHGSFLWLEGGCAERSVARRYTAALSRDLFSASIVEFAWGRIGTRGQGGELVCQRRPSVAVHLSVAAPPGVCAQAHWRALPRSLVGAVGRLRRLCAAFLGSGHGRRGAAWPDRPCRAP